MPTPASVARQCLTKEAEQALDEAVAVARRRGHAQTTSLHMVSSLLSVPSSALREACSRTRNNAYSMRVQFKALELCLGVSLDRLPSSPKRVEEPPVSNSLMAAIKRSQANQRRQPENFNFYQQQQQLLLSSSSSPSSAISVVKVELQNLIFSILDDPVVSRMFGEAGFRSCDIKIAIVRRPVNQLIRYSKYRGPPVFLCNLSAADNEYGRRNFSFPFVGFSGVLDSDDTCRRIAEVMANSRRNPLLVGACASDSLRSFLEMVERRGGIGIGVTSCVLPVELSGLSVICIKNEILKFVSGHYEEGILKLKLEEVKRMVQDCCTGVVISLGDLNALTNDNVLADSLRILVSGLSNLLEVLEQKVWLIGAASRYETFLKFLSMFPTIEKDWNLQLLPVTTLRTQMGESSESYPRSSLMESFVPFGGFFSSPEPVKNNESRRSSFNNASRCHACNEKCNQEVNAISSGRLLISPSVADNYRPNLPSWLQMSELVSSNSGLDAKAKDDRVLLSAEIAGLHRKWDDICHRLNHSPESKEAISCQLDSNNTNFLLRFDETSTKEKDRYMRGSSFNASSDSPSSVTSTTLDLNKEFNTATAAAVCQSSGLEKCDFSFCSSATPEVGSGSDSSNQVKSSSCSQPDTDEQFDGRKDFKTLYAALVERIGWQEEAVKKISQAVARFRGRNRGDKWFYILGHDKLGKMKLAVALAEVIQGSTESLIHVDLGFQEEDEINYSSAVLDHHRHQVWNSEDVRCRGKNVVDYIAEKLRNKPSSVLFLESIEKADLLVQNSLLQAVKTGRFPDSHGREISISNAIFVTTTRAADGEQIMYSEPADYSEDDILSAKPRPIRMMIGFDLCDDFITASEKSRGIILNKRKLCSNSETAKRAHKASDVDEELLLDLNFPTEESEICDTASGTSNSPPPGNSETDSICHNSRTWLEHFTRQMDATVAFQPFDFDAIAQKLVEAISTCLKKVVVPPECSVEIDSRVMTQMIAAAYSTNTKKVEEWINTILGKAFEEAQKKYSLTARSTIKLAVACEGGTQTPSEFLPSRIILN